MVASIADSGGYFGYFSAFLFQDLHGYWVQYTHNYTGHFFCASIAYLSALGIMHLLSRDFRPAVMPGEMPRRKKMVQARLRGNPAI